MDKLFIWIYYLHFIIKSISFPGSLRSGSVHLALLSPAHSPFHSYRTGV